jgi:hypothetical protein
LRLLIVFDPFNDAMGILLGRWLDSRWAVGRGRRRALYAHAQLSCQ